MLSLSIGDVLLIKQTAEIPTSPWGYRIIHLPTSATVVSASTLTSTHELITMDEASAFINFTGETLLLEILDGSNNIIETDTFTLTGIYNKLPEVQKTVGLLGENVKHLSTDDDFRDGFQLKKAVTTYKEAALLNTLESYDWTQTFEDDFTPDARYQRKKVIQKENA